MSNFVPTAYDMPTALIFPYHLKKNAAESQRMLEEAYGNHGLPLATCKRWFQRFRNNDFDVRNEERGKPPKQFKGTELQKLLDEDDTFKSKTNGRHVKS